MIWFLDTITRAREGKVKWLTLKELKQYKSICAELEELNIVIANKTVNNTVTGSDDRFPYTKHAMSVGGLVYTDENRKLLIRRNSLLWEKEKIEDYIERIEDSITRRIFEMRFINGYSWTKIAYRMNSSVSCVKMVCHRYLNKQKAED